MQSGGNTAKVRSCAEYWKCRVWIRTKWTIRLWVYYYR